MWSCFTGAICVKQTAAIKIASCSFRSNSGQKGGALYAQLVANLQLLASSFTANTAHRSGGAVHAELLAPTDLVNISLCTFMQNAQQLAPRDYAGQDFVSNQGSGEGGIRAMSVAPSQLCTADLFGLM